MDSLLATTTHNVSSMPPWPLFVLASVLFILGIYVLYRWAKSYALTLKAMGDFSPVSPNWAYLLFVPGFNMVWMIFLMVYVRNGLKKMHDAGKLSKKEDGDFIFGLLIIPCWIIGNKFGWFALPALSIAAFVFWILSWIKLVEARKAIL